MRAAAPILALLLLPACTGDDADDPLRGFPDEVRAMPSWVLPFRMRDTLRGTNFVDNGLTPLPIQRHLLAVTSTPERVFVVFPPEARDGLDIAWDGAGRDWVRAPLTDEAVDGVRDLHMAAMPDGRVAVGVRSGGTRLILFDAEHGIVRDRDLPRPPAFWSGRISWPEAFTDLAVVPTPDGDVDVLFRRGFTVDGRGFTEVRRNRWLADPNAWRGEEVLLSVETTDLTAPERDELPPGHTIDVGAELTVEALPGADGTRITADGLAFLARRRATRGGVEDDDHDDVMIVQALEGRLPGIRHTGDAVADWKWGRAPSPDDRDFGISRPVYDLAVTPGFRFFWGPRHDAFSANPDVGYTEAGVWTVPYPQTSAEWDSWVQDSLDAEVYRGGFLQVDDCSEVRVWGVPNVTLDEVPSHGASCCSGGATTPTRWARTRGRRSPAPTATVGCRW